MHPMQRYRHLVVYLCMTEQVFFSPYLYFSSIILSVLKNELDLLSPEKCLKNEHKAIFVNYSCSQNSKCLVVEQVALLYIQF